MSYCQKLRELGSDIWDGWHEHPFIKGIGSGKLEREKFIYWIKQDYLYLKDYARVFALAGGKARKLEHMQMFASLMDGILNTEMKLHRDYCAEFGIDTKELENLNKSPTCQSYTDFLVRTAANETVGVTVAALLPCLWGFYEIGSNLEQTGDTSSSNPYRHWIEMYSSQEFADLANWGQDLMEYFAEEAGQEEWESMKQAFLISSKYESMFWEMAHILEEWKF